MTKPTTVSEFYEKSLKVVTLPSTGMTFKLRKINARETLKSADMDILASVRSIMRPDGSSASMAEFWLKLPKEDKKKYVELNDMLIMHGVLEPCITKVREEGAVCIDDIDDKPYNELLKEVQEFSVPKKEELQSFRKEQK